MSRRPTFGKKKNKFMSPSEGRSNKTDTGSKEVDLVPIMNLFVTLIPMLLSVVVFTTIAYVSLDVREIDSTGGGDSEETQNSNKDERISKLELGINISEKTGEEYFYFFKNDTLDEEVGRIPAEDLSALASTLKRYRNVMFEDKYNDTTIRENDEKELPIIVMTKDEIRFGTFVKAIDLCKNMRFTDIALTGTVKE